MSKPRVSDLSSDHYGFAAQRNNSNSWIFNMAKYDAAADRTKQFLRRFQRNLVEYVAQHGSISESFGVVWEKTIEAIPLNETAQGQLYHELIEWAKGQPNSRRHSPVLECLDPSASLSRSANRGRV